MTIVKVQIPLVTNDPNALALVYDEHQKHMLQQPLDAETSAAMGAEVKAYFEAVWHPGDRQWRIGPRVRAQPW